MSISAENAVWKIGRKTILDGITFTATPGKMLGLLGPNGSGKTSLLRLLAGLKKPSRGKILLEGTDIARMNRKDLARRVAFVEQHATTNANLTVLDVVKLGRFPHRSVFSGWSQADEACVKEALASAGMTTKRNDRWQSLSGGEKQRTHLARALAQAPRELILDEPTNHLDVQHQMSLMRLIADLQITSVIALHDLNHAAMFCDEILVLAGGKVIAQGTPEHVLTEHMLREVFAVETRIVSSPYHGRPHIHFMR